MPLDGSGSWVPVGSSVNPAVTNTAINSTDYNALLTDLKTALSTAMFKDGQATPTANIPMGGFRFTGLSAAVSRTDSAALSTVQNSQGQQLGTIAGTNTITAQATPTLTAYTSGQTFRFASAGANTGATTLNIDGLGAKNVFWKGAACAGGEIASGAMVTLTYDGTQFNLATNYSISAVSALSGQCQLQFVSTTSIKLMPWNGNLITVNGVACTVPDAGISLANTGLTQATKYYIYAVATAGAISSIEASTTAYAVSTTTGNKGIVIKTADDTRSLVGMVYMNTGVPGLFGSSTTFQGLRSWFNDLGMSANSGIASNKATASATYVKLDSTTDITFLVWASELCQSWFNGSFVPSGTNQNAHTAVGIDGLVPEDSQNISNTGAATPGRMPTSGTTPARALTEGNHTLSLLGAVDGGNTNTWDGAAAPSTSATTRRTTFGIMSKGVNP